MKKIRYLLILPVAAGIFLLTGCVRFVELSERVIVQSVGIDYYPETGSYRLSMQYFTQSGEGGQNQIDKTQANVLKSVGEGMSICDAAVNASIKTGKDLLFSENRLIIIGSELAGYDLEATLNFFVSDFHSHPKAHVAVADGKAEDIIDIRFKEGTVSTEKLTNLLTNAERHGVCPANMLPDTLISLHSASRSAYLPLLKIVEEKTDVTIPQGGSDGSGGSGGDQGGGQSSDEGMKEKTVELVGGAAFSDGKAVGKGSFADSAGIQLITDRTHELSVTVRTDESETATVTLFKTDFSAEPVITDGKLKFVVKGFAFGRFEERIFLSDTDEETLEEITRQTEKTVKESVYGAVSNIKTALGCDVFGFENVLRCRCPDFWFDNEENIAELIRLADVEVEFSCQPYILGLQND